MNYLITDLECTCCSSQNIIFPREEMEIIEIGAILVDKDLKVLGEYSKFIKPVINPILTDFCTELTTITQEQVDSEKELTDVIFDFHSWAINLGDYKFTSWGAFDFKHIQRECELKGINNPMLQNNFNYKVRFSQIMGTKKGYGLSKALKRLNMKFEGTPHRAISDAQNVLRIMRKVGV